MSKTFSMRYFLFILTLKVALLQCQTDNNPEIELFHGSHFRKIDGAILYHSTIPVTIEIPKTFTALTSFLQDKWKNICPFNNNSTCEIFHSLTNIEEALFSEISTKQTKLSQLKNITKNNVTRRRRGIEAIGDLFHWCCSLVTEGELTSYVKTEDELTTHVNNLQKFIKAEHQDLVADTKHLNTMARDIEHLFYDARFKMNNWQKKFQAEEQTTLEEATNQLLTTMLKTTTFIYLIRLQQNLKEIKIHCSNKQLSELAVNKHELQVKLQDIHRKIQKENYTLAFPEEDVHHLYNLRLTSCIETTSTLKIILQIPIKQKVHTTLYHATSIPLYWENHTCNLIEDAKFIILQEEKISILPTDDNCNEQLCGIPRHTNHHTEDQKCLTHLLTSTNITSMQGICSFKCTPTTNEAVITKLREDIFLLHNVQPNTVLKCNGKTHKIPCNTAGTLKIHVPCNCIVQQDEEEIISKLYPCDGRSMLTPNVTQLLPISWTTLPSLSIPTTENTRLPNYLDLETILDNNWHLNLSDFEQHNIFADDLLEEVHMPTTWDKFVNNSTTLFWCLMTWQLAQSTILIYILLRNYLHNKALKMLNKQRNSQQMNTICHHNPNTNNTQMRDTLI
jgi:hypothetical protein